MPFLPTARSAVGLGITLSPFYSNTLTKVAKVAKVANANKTLTRASTSLGWYSTLLDAT
jgi:hypothetical protein